jgi:hypothetical protein
VQKYLACTQFDPDTGDCVASVWVDPPGFLPTLTPEYAVAFAAMIGVLWIAVAAFYPIQDAVRDN